RLSRPPPLPTLFPYTTLFRSIVADCRAVLPDDAIISLDSGIHHNWFMQFWEARRPQTMLNTWGYSGMGFGPSSILGAKLAAPDQDRKSTRLNSSHVAISYAVF